MGITYLMCFVTPNKVMTSNGLFIDLTSVNTKYMNVGYNVGHYMKSRS